MFDSLWMDCFHGWHSVDGLFPRLTLFPWTDCFHGWHSVDRLFPRLTLCGRTVSTADTLSVDGLFPRLTLCGRTVSMFQVQHRAGETRQLVQRTNGRRRPLEVILGHARGQGQAHPLIWNAQQPPMKRRSVTFLFFSFACLFVCLFVCLFSDHTVSTHAIIMWCTGQTEFKQRQCLVVVIIIIITIPHRRTR